METVSHHKALTICNVDSMVWQFLRPWLSELRRRGHEVHISCAPGPYFDLLAAEGFQMHAIGIHRGFNPLRNLKPVGDLYRLIRDGGFQMINTHSPVASCFGRLAAWLAGGRNVVYTVHGFYFHDNMHPLAKRSMIAIEWMLGKLTDRFLFVSEEDCQTALAVGIARSASQTRTIRNGVDLKRFRPRRGREDAAVREQLGIPADHRVIGIVARLVKEKGYRELFEAARAILFRHEDVTFLVVGDNLPTDRDQFGSHLREQVLEAGISQRFILAGHSEHVPQHLRAMDIFVLPSYREGFPVSVLEAMATGLPVVATDIRGCREAVVDGSTGLLAPPRDADALTTALETLLDQPDLAVRMGAAARRRTEEQFEVGQASRRFATACLEGLPESKGAMEAEVYAGS